MKRSFQLAQVVIPLVVFTTPLAGLAKGKPQDQQAKQTEVAKQASAANSESEEGSSQSGRPKPGAVAPTIGGPSGLFHVISTDVGAQHSFRLGLHIEFFESSDFLVGAPTPDTNSRFRGTLALSYTPWRLLELFANTSSQTNNNRRQRPSPQTLGANTRLDPAVISSLGDFAFGAKFRYPFFSWLQAGLLTRLAFFNSVEGTSLAGDATSFYAGLITSLHISNLLRMVTPVPIPIRLHLNAGYFLDNTDKLTNFSSDDLPSVIHVSKFAYGINRPRFQFKLGLDATLTRWTVIPVTPIWEFHVDVATGSADSDFQNRPQISAADLSGRTSLSTTLGVRVNPVQGLNLDIASDIGIASPGFGYGPPTPPWNLIIGLSFAFDPLFNAQPTAKELPKKEDCKVTRPTTTTVSGQVVAADTGEPIEGAVITFAGKNLTRLYSDPDGGFTTYDFKTGPLHLLLRHPDYEAKRVKTTVQPNAQPLRIEMVRAAPKTGKLDGKVTSEEEVGIFAELSVSGGPEGSSRQLPTQADGSFSVELPPGDYVIRAQTSGFLTKQRLVTVTAGSSQTISFLLRKRPEKPLARLAERAIVIQRQVHFDVGTATLQLNSHQVLDSVIDVLISNSQIKRIEIQGHTDNTGSASRNAELSQQRAEAVREYLIQQGVAPTRLVSKGYGSKRPKRPNISARNRAINRRVEFVIADLEP